MALTRFGEICRTEEMGAYNAPDTIEKLIQRSESNDRYDLVLAANNPNTPKEIVLKLTRSGHSVVRRACARNNDVNLVELSNDPDRTVRWALAENPALPMEVVPTLIKEGIQHRLIYNENLSAYYLDLFAREFIDKWNSGDEYHVNLLKQIASHKNTPLDTLMYLYNLSYNRIDYGIARNPNAPAELLEQLYNKWIEDWGWAIEAIAGNSNTPVTILEKLYEEFKYESAQFGTDVILSLATNKSIPITLMRKMWGELEDFMFARRLAINLHQNPTVNQDPELKRWVYNRI